MGLATSPHGFDVYGFSGEDGKQLWHTQLAGGATVTGGRTTAQPTGPVVGGGYVLLGDWYGDRWLLDSRNGKLLWETGAYTAAAAHGTTRPEPEAPLDFWLRSTGAIVGGRVYLCKASWGILEGREVASGKVLWQHPAPPWAYGLAADASGVFVSCEGGKFQGFSPSAGNTGPVPTGMIRAYRAKDGKQRWAKKMPRRCWQLVAGPAGVVIAAGYEVVAMDASSGRFLWRARVVQREGDLDAVGYSPKAKAVYALDQDGTLWCLDAAKGSARWHLDLSDGKGGRRLLASSLSLGSVVSLIVSSTSGSALVSVSLDGKWKQKLPLSPVEALTHQNVTAQLPGYVYVVSAQGLRCLKAHN